MKVKKLAILIVILTGTSLLVSANAFSNLATNPTINLAVRDRDSQRHERAPRPAERERQVTEELKSLGEHTTPKVPFTNRSLPPGRQGTPTDRTQQSQQELNRLLNP